MGNNSMMQMNYNQGMQGMMGMNMVSSIQPQSNINMSNNALNSKDSSNVKLENSNNGSINLILKIPLLNEKYEKIKIEFKKENKDIRKQYEKLKNKFLKIKKIVYPDLEEKNTQNNQMNPNSMQGPMGQQSQMGMVMPTLSTGISDAWGRTPDSILSQIKNEFEN